MVVRVSHSMEKIKAIKNNVLVTNKEHAALSETSQIDLEVSGTDMHTFVRISFFFCLCN